MVVYYIEGHPVCLCVVLVFKTHMKMTLSVFRAAAALKYFFSDIYCTYFYFRALLGSLQHRST